MILQNTLKLESFKGLLKGICMSNIYYPAIFHPEEIGYSVSVPDLEGCFTQGKTLNEAVEIAQDAISLILKDCKTLPPASDPSAIRIAEHDFIMMIPFNRTVYQLVYQLKCSDMGQINEEKSALIEKLYGCVPDSGFSLEDTKRERRERQ